MIDFTTFKGLYGEAKEATSEEHYIVNRGWQEWMTETNGAVDILHKIYAVVKNGFKALLPEYKNLKSLCEYLALPYGTAQKWKNDVCNPPEYVLMQLLYATINKR